MSEPENLDKTVQLKTGEFSAGAKNANEGEEKRTLPKPEDLDRTVQLKTGEFATGAKNANTATANLEGTACLQKKTSAAQKLLNHTGVFSRKRDIDEEIARTAVELTPPPTGENVLTIEGEAPPDGAHLDERYTLMDVFAEGGHGIISVAKDKALQRLVALKSLKLDFLSEEKIVSSFISEARLTSQLEHPSVVPIYSMERDDSHGVHLAMKLIKGRTLKDYLAQIIVGYNRSGVAAFDERKSLTYRLDIFLRVCDALAYAHSKNIMHCDLKPENIMIGEYRETYLMDWGIARLIEEPGYTPETWVKPKTISGTPKYLSPEAINGEHTDQRADIFAMGLILFELVTLSPSITGSNPLEVMNKIRGGEFEPFRHRFGSHLDGDLKAIVRKALSLAREQRYQSVSRLAEDIRRYLRFAEVSARPDKLPMKCVRWLYLHRTAAALLVAAALLTGASGIALALYERMNSIELTREREGKINTVHGNTMSAAFSIDRLALHLENNLKAIAAEATFLLSCENNAKTGKCYSCKELENKATAPADMSYSSVYKMTLSPGNFIYKPPTGMGKEEAAAVLKRLAPVAERLPYTVMESIPGANVTKDNIETAKLWLLEKGYPIRWLYFGLENGFYFCYPGRASYPESYDPRLRPWYKEGKKFETAHWASPYIDSGGQGIVIPCTAPLLDDDNKLLGVAGMDIAFDFIVSRLKSHGNQQPVVIDKYLVNKEGRIVVSTNSKYAGLAYTPGTVVNELPTLPEFPDKELFNMMRNDNFGTIIKTDDSGREMLYSYASIHTLSLIYIEQIDFDKLMAQPNPKPPEAALAHEKR